ncbi:MAG: sulfotransferase family protein [Rhodospirillales bacterium]|nr:sulfotransferase family protein [Rhodospirillales bacterium]
MPVEERLAMYQTAVRDHEDDTVAARTKAKGILVFGMHRSGTSAITRALNLWGAGISSALLDAQPDNPTGFWEPVGLVALHDAVLAELGSSWDDITALDLASLPPDAHEAYRQGLAEILARDFADASLFVLKDPRMCRLAPLAIEGLRAFGTEPVAVIAIRHPLEVIGSLGRRAQAPPDWSQLMWLRYVLDAERYTREIPRIFVSYDHLLTDWRSARGSVETLLGVHWPLSEDSVSEAVSAFLKPTYRHHTAGADHLGGNEVLPWGAASLCGAAFCGPQRRRCCVDRNV